MTQQDWSVQAYLYDPKTDSQTDYLPTTPGPEMNRWLQALCSEHKMGLGKLNVFLEVKHLPTGYSEKARIYRDNREFRAWYGGDLIKLDRAVKLLKGDLWPYGA